MTRVSKKVRPGFTLMELMVAVALLVGVILAVGMVFQGTSKAVSLSQATTEAFTGVRSLQSKIEKDLSGLDPNGFLLIRSRTLAGRRFDQIAFLSNGSFRNPTGGNVGGNATFVDRSVANAARVWYGHLVIAADGVSTLDANGTPVTYASQASAVALNALPTGQRDQDFVLGRQATLLFPDDGYGGAGFTITSVQGLPILAFRAIPTVSPDIQISAAIPAANMPTGETGANCSITSSRCAAAGFPSTVIKNSIMVNAVSAATGIRSNATYELDNYCYRFRALPNIWSSGSVANAYFRMHPILLSGVPSFAVEWSDGSTNTTTGALNWYGYGNRKSAVASLTEPTPSGGSADDYVAQFSFDSKAQWPKALRFTYRVTDPQDRLAGGRTFVQVVALPR